MLFRSPGSRSAIDKHPLAGTVTIGELGFAGDEQGDPRVHGGPDNPVHHYAFDHYPAWREDIGDSPLLRVPGAFGENISPRDLDECNVCLGEIERAHVCTPVTNAHLACSRLLENKTQ